MSKYRYYEQIKDKYIIQNMETLEIELVSEEQLKEGIALGLVERYSLQGELTRRLVAGVGMYETIFETNQYKIIVIDHNNIRLQAGHNLGLRVELKLDRNPLEPINLYLIHHNCLYEFNNFRHNNIRSKINIIGVIDKKLDFRSREMQLNTYLDFSYFDTSKAEDMTSMFYKFQVTSLDISSFDLTNVTSMENMFSWSSVYWVTLPKTKSPKLKNIANMFSHSNIEKVNINDLDTHNVEQFLSIFGACQNLREIDISELDITNAKDLGYLFTDCGILERVNWGTRDIYAKKLENVAYMYAGCHSLRHELTLNSLDAPNLVYFDCMYYNCNILRIVDLSYITCNKDARLDMLISESNNIGTVYLPKDTEGNKVQATPHQLFESYYVNAPIPNITIL